MIKKIIIGFFVFLFLAIGALIAFPFVFKDQIAAKVKEEINNEFNAKVDYGNFDLTVLHSFPNLTFNLENFTIIGKDEFLGDTLIAMKDFKITLDIMTVYRKEKYKVIELLMQDPTIYALVNKAGKTNWDILKQKTGDTGGSSKSNNFALEIKKYLIENGNIVFDDQKAGNFIHLQNLNYEAKGDLTQDIYQLANKITIDALTVKSGAIAYLSNVKLDAQNEINIDQKNSKYTFKENTLKLNDLTLLYDGFVKMNPNTIDVDLKFKSKEASFKSILSMIPALYKNNFDKIKASGSLALEGNAKGVYSTSTLPAFNLNMKVENSMFQYPSLPTAVTNVNVLANIQKPQGTLDGMVIDIPKLHANLGIDPIDAVIHVKTPISDPNVDAKILGKLNLADVPKFYPMDGLKKLEGLLNADITFKGKMSDVEKKNYTAIQAAGTLDVASMKYDSKETPMPLDIPVLKLTFNPQNVTLNNMIAKVGKSDFNATGTLNNFIGYFFSKGALQGTLNLQCNQFDANEWLAKETTSGPTTGSAKKDTAKTKFFQVPSNIDFTANSQFGKILYDKLTLSNVKGTVIVKDETLNLNNLFANLLGGSANINAVYSTKLSNTPAVTFNYDIKNFDFKQTYNYVGMAQKIAPIIEHIEGSFSSDLKGSGKFNNDMSVDYSSLTGDGKVSIPYAKIVNMPIIQKITEVVKIPALQNLELKNAFTVLQFKDGKVAVDPTDLKFGNGYGMNFSGKNGFDQSIDYDVRFDVPTKDFGGYANNLIGMIPKIPGLNLAMPETLNLFLKVGGTATKPTIKLNKVGSGGTNAKDMVKNTVDDLKKKAEEEAKKQLDNVKQQAEQQVNQVKQQVQDQVKQQTDNIKKDAEDKVKDVVKGFKLPW